MKTFFLIIIISLITVSHILAQNFWTPTGFSYGGHVYSLVVANNNNIIAGHSAGIYLSTNGGSSWTKVFNSSNDVISLARKNSNGYLYAGLAISGGGVYRSTNNGSSWSYVGLSNRKINDIAVSSNGVIFTASAGSTKGVFKSSDNGSSWISSGLDSYDVYSLFADTLGNVYASTGNDGFVFKSSDNGSSWNALYSWGVTVAVREIAKDYSDNLFCINSPSGKLYKSSNNGSTWVEKMSGINYYDSPPILVNLTNTLFLGDYGGGVYRSTDSGETWTAINSGLGNSMVHCLCADNNGFIYAGTAGSSIYKSTVSTTVPLSPGIPSGSVILCQDPPNSTYSITPVPGATSYTWQLYPISAGTISGSVTSAIVDWNNSFYGTAKVFVKACNLSGCSNNSDSLSVAINQAPTISNTVPGTRCGAGTVSLSATPSAGVINWYASMTGGSSLYEGTSFITPSISVTTTYYVDATLGQCTTSSRTAIVATVNSIPTITGTIPGARCGTGIVILSATASSGVINWYASLIGGPSLHEGTSFTTPSISTTTTYYVDAMQGQCTTPSRTVVVATVNSSPTITSTSPGTRCGTGTVTLSATASAGTINWYSSITGGSSLYAGTNFTTPSISSTTTYYVDATSDQCTTPSRTAVVATVNPINNVSISVSANPSGLVCTGIPVTFTATATNGGSSPVYQWQKNGINVGNNSNSYTDLGLVNSDQVKCILTSNISCPAVNPATSNIITMAVQPCEGAPVTTAGTITATPGQIVVIPITADNFQDITAISLTLHYDPTVLTWMNVQNINPNLSAFDITDNVGPSGLRKILFSWFGNTTSLPNGSTLCELKFHYINGATELDWFDDGGSCEYADEEGNALNDMPNSYYYHNGQVSPPNKSVNFTLFLQGLYNSDLNQMNKAQNASGNQFGGNIADKIDIEIRQAISPYSILQTFNNIDLSTSGICTLSAPYTFSGSYYFVIKHRNSIETWTANPLSLNDSAINYNFTDAASKSYGANMKLINGKYCIYGGDVNQDGIVDAGDMISVDNLSSTFSMGYIPEDANGDCLIDSGDMILIDNNASSFISTINPITSPTSLNLGLKAYYPFNGNAIDESGTGNNGNISGASLTTDRFNNANTALSFNGTNSYVWVNQHSTLEFGTGDFTVCAWIKTPSQQFSRVVSKGECFSSGWQLGQNSTIEVSLQSPPNGPSYLHSINNNYADNQWHFILMRRSNGIVQIFGDGDPDGTPYVFPYSLTNESALMTIGRCEVSYGSCSDAFFNGSIDDVRIYNRALDQAEIDTLYHWGGWLNTNAGLVAYYPFNGNANDESGNNNNGSVNGAILTTDRMNNPDAAYFFNGTNQSITTTYPGILGGNPRSVSFWIKSNSSTHQYFVSWGATSAFNNFVCGANYPFNPDGVQCEIGSSYVLYTATINDGNWHHVVYIVPNIPSPTMGDVICYFDGIKLTSMGGSINSSAVINTISSPSWYLKFGAETINSSFSIDDVRIYNRELSENEVNILFNQ
jgi:photosystem II stability/assembly factor-like uncharacterized protein